MMPRSEEEWDAHYDSGAAEYYEARNEEAREELAQLRGRIAMELEAINRHIAVTPKDSKWWMWSHGVKDALEGLLEGTSIAGGDEQGPLYLESCEAKYISTPTLACNWLRLKGGLFDSVKIPIDAATGTLLDGQRVTVTVTTKEEDGGPEDH